MLASTCPYHVVSPAQKLNQLVHMSVLLHAHDVYQTGSQVCARLLLAAELKALFWHAGCRARLVCLLLW